MPGQVGAISNEREGLLAYLAQMRYVLKLTAYGLTPDQLRATPTAGTLSVGGLIKHCSTTEEGWIDTVRLQPAKVDYEAYNANFHLTDDETLESVIADYDRVAAKTEETIAGIDDLGRAVPVDHSVPWNPKDIDNWSVRWVLLHLIQETARHTGHADIIREAIDAARRTPSWPRPRTGRTAPGCRSGSPPATSRSDRSVLVACAGRKNARHLAGRCRAFCTLAVVKGFEPLEGLHPHTLSRRAP